MSIITQKVGTLEYLVAQHIPAPHCFTTRHGGVSTGPLSSMNLAIKLDETEENVAENFRILGNALGFTLSDLVLTRQTHSDIVRVVGREDCKGCFHRDYPECDALVTNSPGVTLVVFTADCTPILLCDPVTGAVGAAHAGWRGTALAIGGKAVQAMAEHFGCDPANIRAAIGPNIGFCHFETDADVPEAILAAYGEEAAPYIEQRGEKYYLDLKAINALSLRRAGVTHIEISEDCTMCSPDRFWSHRVTRGIRGSQGALIQCKEVVK
ncbi:MAG: peptidoglycan editing factor PgeF [Oscillospiraceae bacterium]|nr:peptidoglycan editing factor PgeF [Oscillospiraceae bacterium]